MFVFTHSYTTSDTLLCFCVCYSSGRSLSWCTILCAVNCISLTTIYHLYRVPIKYCLAILSIDGGALRDVFVFCQFLLYIVSQCNELIASGVCGYTYFGSYTIDCHAPHCTFCVCTYNATIQHMTDTYTHTYRLISCHHVWCHSHSHSHMMVCGIILFVSWFRLPHSIGDQLNVTQIGHTIFVRCANTLKYKSFSIFTCWLCFEPLFELD